jgi:transcriptional regulator with XRE-family HTH domain
MLYNMGLVKEIRQRDSIDRADLARMVGVTDNYFYKLEKGKRRPSSALMRRIAGIIGTPYENLLVIDAEERLGISDGARVVVDMRKDIDLKSHHISNVEKRISELEQEVVHLRALLDFHTRFEDIQCQNLPSNSEKLQLYKELAKMTARESELSFNEMLVVLRVKRADLRSWLYSEKKVFKCRFAEDGEILALAPGEAALRLRCFDCKAFESGECAGHGNEKRPDNIVELILRLEAFGVIGKEEQAEIITECYRTPVSQHEISEILYRNSRGLPVPEGLFYLDRPSRKVYKKT